MSYNLEVFDNKGDFFINLNKLLKEDKNKFSYIKVSKKMYYLTEGKRELFADKLLKEGYWVKYDLISDNIYVKRNDSVWELPVEELLKEGKQV